MYSSPSIPTQCEWMNIEKAYHERTLYMGRNAGEWMGDVVCVPPVVECACGIGMSFGPFPKPLHSAIVYAIDIAAGVVAEIVGGVIDCIYK